MHRKDKLLSGWFGRFFTGSFTKKDGTRREVWGVMKNDPNVPAHLVVVYDLRVKQYRRFDITKPFNIRSGGDFIAAGSALADQLAEQDAGYENHDLHIKHYVNDIPVYHTN